MSRSGIITSVKSSLNKTTRSFDASPNCYNIRPSLRTEKDPLNTQYSLYDILAIQGDVGIACDR